MHRLAGIWAAAGALGCRRRAALTAHVERLRLAVEARDKPGSHSWPNLRREAEQRFAAGEPPAVVIDELRGSYRDGPAIVPSLRTMRRWFAQGRWLIPHWLTQRVRPQRITSTTSDPEDPLAVIPVNEHAPKQE